MHNFIGVVDQWKLSTNIRVSTDRLHSFHSYDIDSGKLYFNQLQSNASSSYYLDDEFNSMLMQSNIDNNFSVLHVNARNLPKNLDYLEVYLQTLNHNFSVIDVFKTWTNNDNMSLLHIPGYTVLLKTEPQEEVVV